MGPYHTLRQCPISPGEWGAATSGSGRCSAGTRERRMEGKQGVKAPHACPLSHVHARCECGRGDDPLPDKPTRRRPLSVGGCAGSARHCRLGAGAIKGCSVPVIAPFHSGGIAGAAKIWWCPSRAWFVPRSARPSGVIQGPYPGPLKAASGPGWVALLRVRGPPLPGWQSSHPPRATTVTTCMQVPLLVWAADAGVACLPSQTECHCLGSPEKTRCSEHTR
jgi:hypothetical protein